MKQFETLVVKFTKTEYEYFINLSELTKISKFSMVELLSNWLQLQLNNNVSPNLDFSCDFDEQSNPWRKFNVKSVKSVNHQLREQAKYLNVSRYELVRALIKKFPELLKSGELFDFNAIDYNNFKRKDD